jgi:hypothetical protein
MSSDVPYWRPPTPRSVWSFSWRFMVSNEVYFPQHRFWPVSVWLTTRSETARRQVRVASTTYGHRL